MFFITAAAVVGLEVVFQNVSEGVGVVEVCVVVFSPNETFNCPISFSFSVSLSTSDVTAGMFLQLHWHIIVE